VVCASAQPREAAGNKRMLQFLSNRADERAQYNVAAATFERNLQNQPIEQVILRRNQVVGASDHPKLGRLLLVEALRVIAADPEVNTLPIYLEVANAVTTDKGAYHGPNTRIIQGNLHNVERAWQQYLALPLSGEGEGVTDPNPFQRYQVIASYLAATYRYQFGFRRIFPFQALDMGLDTLAFGQEGVEPPVVATQKTGLSTLDESAFDGLYNRGMIRAPVTLPEIDAMLRLIGQK